MKRSTKILAGATAFVLLGFALWAPVVEPLLVRFPDNVNDTMHYEGTFTTFVDMQSGAALPAPDVQPLKAERVIRSVPGQTGATTATIQEVLTLKVGGLDQWQASRFVLDRHSMKNVRDARANAYGLPVDRSGAYYPIAPMGVEAGHSYPLWFDEAGISYPLTVPAGAKTEKVHGLSVLRAGASVSNRPVAPQFAASVLKLAQAPTQLTFDGVKAQMKAKGVDFDQLTATILPLLTPAEVSTLAATIQKPLPLQYYAFLKQGEALLEPNTGIVVGLTMDDKGVAVAPDFTPWLPLQQVLAAHSDNPAVKAATDRMTAMATAPPQPVFETRVSETPASIARMADKAATQADKLRLATFWAPGILAAIVVLLTAATIVSWRRPRPPAEVAPPVAFPTREARPKAA